jgi:hypothetical protein
MVFILPLSLTRNIRCPLYPLLLYRFLQQVLTAGVDARQLIGTLLRTPPLRYQFLLACQVEAAAAADYCACVRGSDRKCRVERSPLRMRGRVNVDALNAWSRVCRCYPAGKNSA